VSKPEPVVAAGAVPWRVVNGKLQVLVVYRKQHRDVSIPKGKVDPGETLPHTAVREIFEETGLKVNLGPSLGSVHYVQTSNGKPKIVHYWAAEVDPVAEAKSKFVSNDEIFAIEWLSVKKAIATLTYEHDRELIEDVRSLWKSGSMDTFPLIITRHGKATAHDQWDGLDSLRPLVAQGMQQARDIAGGLAAFGPDAIMSSPAIRCLQTIAPLSYKLGMEIRESGKISQDKWTSEGDRVVDFVSARLRKAVPVVMCSHGPVIPQIVSEIISQTGGKVSDQARRAASLGTGDFAVFHIAKSGRGFRLVSIETHTAP
jgi:8-oxo-dGTP diphosphatase